MSGQATGALRERKSNIWARDAYDWYVEPEWCSQRLFDVEPFVGEIVDPACGIGRIVGTARAAGYRTQGLDIVRRSDACDEVADFMSDVWQSQRPCWPENIVSNPPFKLCDPKPGVRPKGFVELALERTCRKVALLLPASWLFGVRRAERLRTTPLRRVHLLVPRPSMPPGAVIAAGEKVGGGTTDFAWFVWEHGYRGLPEITWLDRGTVRA